MRDDEADGPHRERVDLRETYRRQMLDSIGGWTGTLITAIPPVVFVIINSIYSLRPAIVSAISTALLLAIYRLVRRQPTQQALTGLFGVVIAAIIAARTGQARGYFLLGIWSSFAYAVPFAVSLVVRRPLVGLLWEFLDPIPDGAGELWHRRRGLVRAYAVATLIATALFLSRGIVQLTLYGQNATGWLAFARVAMGYPLYIAAVALCFWIVTRARHRVIAAIASEAALAPELGPPAENSALTSADDVAPDRGLGLG